MRGEAEAIQSNRTKGWIAASGIRLPRNDGCPIPFPHPFPGFGAGNLRRFSGGSVTIGNDTRACGTAPEGALRYDSTNDVMEYCNGTDWVNPNSGGGGSFASCGGAPTGCENIGDVCPSGSPYEGTVFAGCHPTLLGEALFLHPDNQSTGVEWDNPSSGTTSATSIDDGRANYNAIGPGNMDASNFQAFHECEKVNLDQNSTNYDSHGHTDWYLPSRVELYYLWSIQDDINNASPGGEDFLATVYWSSTEDISSFAWYQNFSNGNQSNVIKTGNFDVRCLRRS